MQKLLVEMDFGTILNSSEAMTQTGSSILDKYRSYNLTTPVSFYMVNNFIKEASNCRYDKGINNILEKVIDYVNSNKTKWALATACESINSNNKSHNYLEVKASKQVEKLLEMNEDDVVKYIKAGALKNVMYCESFRSIAKQVYKNQPIIEAAADYTIYHPISLVESVGDGVCFQVYGNIYKMDDDKNIQEAQLSDVSNTFINISRLMNSNIAKIDENSITINAGNSAYEITEANKVTKITGDKKQELTVEQLRDNNRLIIMATPPQSKNNLAGILESIAQLCENYDNVMNLDNVSVYTTKSDRFIVIESEHNLYASLLQSLKHQKWTVNENAIDVLSFIKTKTNVSLSDRYKNIVENNIEAASEKEAQKIQEELENQKIDSYRNRIEILTEKFKNDPVKLAILSRIAQQLNS